MQGMDISEMYTYDYEYEENANTGRHWTTRTQYNGSNTVMTRVRHFYQTTSRVQSDELLKYEIDWNFDNEPAIVPSN